MNFCMVRWPINLIWLLEYFEKWITPFRNKLVKIINLFVNNHNWVGWIHFNTTRNSLRLTRILSRLIRYHKNYLKPLKMNFDEFSLMFNHFNVTSILMRSCKFLIELLLLMRASLIHTFRFLYFFYQKMSYINLWHVSPMFFKSNDINR